MTVGQLKNTVCFLAYRKKEAELMVNRLKETYHSLEVVELNPVVAGQIQSAGSSVASDCVLFEVDRNDAYEIAKNYPTYKNIY